MRLSGNVAIVTGGTSGIGRRIVEVFVAHGAAVVFSGRRASLGEDIAKRTRAIFVKSKCGDRSRCNPDNRRDTLFTWADRYPSQQCR